jgi:hypothetical protein
MIICRGLLRAEWKEARKLERLRIAKASRKGRPHQDRVSRQDHSLLLRIARARTSQQNDQKSEEVGYEEEQKESLQTSRRRIHGDVPDSGRLAKVVLAKKKKHAEQKLFQASEPEQHLQATKNAEPNIRLHSENAKEIDSNHLKHRWEQSQELLSLHQLGR